ncbi:MAG: GNAT family N-acetyltransferase [Achromobacter sp.]|uniref:GNAT family N-acetyltransferase n=1 Tax=Achromobacter sp. TaxID=134375 RepID=UPI003CFC6A60
MPAPSASVTLRRLRADDVPMILAMESDPEVMRYSTGVKPATEARRQELLDWLREPPTDIGHWAVVTQDRSVGWISLTPLEGTGGIQLAYRLCRAAWGHGYASDAGRQLCAYAWRSLPVDELVAVAWPRNLGSIRVLEKLGFAFRGMEQHYQRETAVYSLARSEA